MPDPNWEENDIKNGRGFAGMLSEVFLRRYGVSPEVFASDKEPEIRDVELEGPKLLEVDFAKAEVATFAAVMADQLPVIEVDSGNKAVDFAVTTADALHSANLATAVTDETGTGALYFTKESKNGL